jgi:hypothetical protein
MHWRLEEYSENVQPPFFTASTISAARLTNLTVKRHVFTRLLTGKRISSVIGLGLKRYPLSAFQLGDHLVSCYNDKTRDDRFNRPSSGCNSSATTHTTKRRISLVESWARGEWHHSRSDGKDLWSEEQGIMMRAPLGLRIIVKGKIQGALDVVRPSIRKLENIKYGVFLQLSLLSPEQAINSSRTHTLFFTKLQISISFLYISAIDSFFFLTQISLSSFEINSSVVSILPKHSKTPKIVNPLQALGPIILSTFKLQSEYFDSLLLISPSYALPPQPDFSYYNFSRSKDLTSQASDQLLLHLPHLPQLPLN